jgi:hypothetical protein
MKAIILLTLVLTVSAPAHADKQRDRYEVIGELLKEEDAGTLRPIDYIRQELRLVRECTRIPNPWVKRTKKHGWIVRTPEEYKEAVQDDRPKKTAGEIFHTAGNGNTVTFVKPDRIRDGEKPFVYKITKDKVEKVFLLANPATNSTSFPVPETGTRVRVDTWIGEDAGERAIIELETPPDTEPVTGAMETSRLIDSIRKGVQLETFNIVHAAATWSANLDYIDRSEIWRNMIAEIRAKCSADPALGKWRGQANYLMFLRNTFYDVRKRDRSPTAPLMASKDETSIGSAVEDE